MSPGYRGDQSELTVDAVIVLAEERPWVQLQLTRGAWPLRPSRAKVVPGQGSRGPAVLWEVCTRSGRQDCCRGLTSPNHHGAPHALWVVPGVGGGPESWHRRRCCAQLCLAHPPFNVAPSSPQCRSRRPLPAPWRSRPARRSCVTPAGACARGRCCGCRASTSTSSASSAKVSTPARFGGAGPTGGWGAGGGQGLPRGCASGPSSVSGSPLDLGHWKN